MSATIDQVAPKLGPTFDGLSRLSKSINGRNESRSYAKNVREFASDAKLSPEEEEAIELLRKEAS